MLTAGKAKVYSAWFSTFEKRGEENGSQAFYRNRSAPGLLHGRTVMNDDNDAWLAPVSVNSTACCAVTASA
jgi:hypothetical protein